ncbi:hypothetical protein ABVT39_011135 [Epinephelus coioides]
MARSAGLLRARHARGLSSLRSLCRLMPAWISVNLCQAGRIKGNIYKEPLCWSALEKDQEVSLPLALTNSAVEELQANHRSAVDIQNGGGCDRAADVWSLDLAVVSHHVLTWLISSLQIVALHRGPWFYCGTSDQTTSTTINGRVYILSNLYPLIITENISTVCRHCSLDSTQAAPRFHREHVLGGLSDVRLEVSADSYVGRDNDFCDMNKWQRALSSSSPLENVSPVRALVLKRSQDCNECRPLVTMLSASSRGGDGDVKTSRSVLLLQSFILTDD